MTENQSDDKFDVGEQTPAEAGAHNPYADDDDDDDEAYFEEKMRRDAEKMERVKKMVRRANSFDIRKHKEAEDTAPKGGYRNPYNYRKLENVPARKEAEISDLFPYRNAKGYNTAKGREFLEDFTTQTRGQLVFCMSQLAQENPKEFAKLWIEMAKFNIPQQTAMDLNANINTRTSLYAKLQAMSGPKMQEDQQQNTQFTEDMETIAPPDFSEASSTSVRTIDDPWAPEDVQAEMYGDESGFSPEDADTDQNNTI